MTDIHLDIVRFALALHVGIDPEDVAADQLLEADLGLDPLDLVLVVLRLEEIEDAEFPVADLETVATVDDLATVVRSWSSVPPCSPETDIVERLLERRRSDTRRHEFATRAPQRRPTMGA